MPRKKTEDGYIVEFIPHGNSVKVTAIDPRTGREVSIVGASSVPNHELGQLAIRKLQYVLNRDGEDS